MLMMELLATLVLTLTACVLHASAQDTVYRPRALVLSGDTCLDEEEVSARAVNNDITDVLRTIAAGLVAGESE